MVLRAATDYLARERKIQPEAFETIWNWHTYVAQKSVREAEEDYQVAVTTHHGPRPFHNTVCFHCKQAAEKYLKRLLEENDLAVPKIHDLDEVCGLLLSTYGSLRRLRRGLSFLTRFAVAPRYLGDDANKREAVVAVRCAGKVRNEARSWLGLPTPEQMVEKKRS